jgi:succinate-semialdehyde dehydrogenase / glutarate-semialdehyde dehydrogenase
MESFNTSSPFNGETLAHFNYLEADQLELKLKQAEQMAHKARRQSWLTRQKILLGLQHNLLAKKHELALLISQEMGKPLAEALAEVEKSATVFSYYAQEGEHQLKSEEVIANYHSMTLTKEPMGIVLSILPWNFPVWQWARVAAPAIAIGNILLFKHAEPTAGVAQVLHQLSAEVEPGQIVNLVISHQQTKAVIEDSRVKGVSFTGSTRGGRQVAAIAGAALKKTVLELGGNDAYVIFNDANLESAVKSCVKSRFLNTGQSCVAGKRFIIHKDVFGDFVNRYRAVTLELKYVFKNTESGDLGPLVNQRACAELERQIDFAKLHSKDRNEFKIEKWIELGSRLASGCYFPVMALIEPPRTKEWMAEELFGPVPQFYSYGKWEEAAQLVNLSPYGLGGGVFTSQSPEAAKSYMQDLDVGMVTFNDFVKSDPRAPFGGVKDSGWGKELSEIGLLEFANLKTSGFGGRSV